MAIFYRKITVNTTAPSSHGLGAIWVKTLPTTYQSHIWINSWIPWVGGGIFITESDADDHYLNVIVQEDAPDTLIQTEWIWIKESISTAYLYLFGNYVPIATG